MSNIEVSKIIDPIPASDGAGVKLKRSIGVEPNYFDPFLMLDEFGSENSEDYIAGFPPLISGAFGFSNERSLTYCACTTIWRCCCSDSALPGVVASAAGSSFLTLSGVLAISISVTRLPHLTLC